MGCYNSPPLEGIAPRDSKKKRKVGIVRSKMIFGGRRCAWFKVDDKFNSCVRWHTWELLRDNIKKVADHWNNLNGLERADILATESNVYRQCMAIVGLLGQFD